MLAGEVIARDDIVGTIRPRAAMIDTMMDVVRFPGRPQTERLSTIISAFHDSRSPTSIIAFARARISSRTNGRTDHGVMNDAKSMSEYRPPATSPMIALRAPSFKTLP